MDYGLWTMDRGIGRGLAGRQMCVGPRAWRRGMRLSVPVATGRHRRRLRIVVVQPRSRARAGGDEQQRLTMVCRVSSAEASLGPWVVVPSICRSVALSPRHWRATPSLYQTFEKFARNAAIARHRCDTLEDTNHVSLDATAGTSNEVTRACVDSDRHEVRPRLTHRLSLLVPHVIHPQASLLVCNAGAILNEKRVLEKCTW